MKRFFVCWGASLLFALPALAQEATPSEEAAQTTQSAEEPAEAATQPEASEAEEKKDEDKGVYRKKVKGLLWVEGTAGPSAYKPSNFKNVSLGGVPLLGGKATGPEFGIAGGVMLGSFSIGVRFKRANYTGFDLNSLGLDMSTLINSIPYVHPLIKFAINYNSLRNSGGIKGDGGGVLLGVGVRVPVIKWISIAISFDYSVIGMYLRAAGNKEGTAGNQLAGTFALTFHPF